MIHDWDGERVAKVSAAEHLFIALDEAASKVERKSEKARKLADDAYDLWVSLQDVPL